VRATAVRWVSTAVRAARAVRRVMMSHQSAMRVNAKLDDGYVESIAIHLDGTIAVSGWSKSLESFRAALSLTIGGARLPPTQAYRVRRPDLAAAFGSDVTFLGSTVEWVTTARERDQPAVLHGGNRVLMSFVAPAFDEPAYAHLRNETRVVGRDQIYGYGPPVPYVSVEVLELARTLPPPILDFGCGAGALVRALRGAGIEAYGLELDEGRIREHLLEEARPWVTLYDGRLPAPFRDRQFMSVCCSEVLEHIPDPAAVIHEIARLAANRALITVPDISAIPRGYHHGVVPWHLLESTHVNFFTQASLEALLAPMVSRVGMARIGAIVCDRMSYYTSLAAIVER
jgi:SAM-dependent methyltransferase